MVIQSEITQLGAEYSIAVDDHDIEFVLDCFTADGSFERAGAVHAGRDTLRGFYVAMMDRYRFTRHVPETLVIRDLDDTEALTLTTGSAELLYGDTLMRAAYRYFDVCRLDDGRWRYARRKLDFLYVVPAEAMSASMVDRNRIRWPDAPPAPADFPESLRTWETYR